MGFWDNLLGRNKLPISLLTPRVTVLGGADEYAANLGASSPSDLWSSQPHLRTVVSFLARNVAQLGLHSFERVGEDRRRDRTSPFAATMLRPNDDQTAFDLIYSLVGDMALYDRAYWLVAPDSSASGWMFRRLPPAWVSENPRDAFGAKSYDVIAPDQSVVTVPADSVLAFTGYHPQNPSKGSPTIEALKDLLREQSEAATYRAQVWKRGGRVSAVLQRPAGAPDWSPEARDRFREDWYAKFTGRGERAGGTPILEDGMTLNRVDFSAQEQQFVDVAKLAVTTVAAAFHVNPTMIGVLDNANYSNVREFRRMLYGDTLGPLLAQIEARVNTFLLPMLEMDPATHYAEFNIGEKLQGSFEEQAAVMQTLVGAPLFSRNEGRAMFNKPAIPGGDGLVTPLNVLIGGQASPTDSGTQNQTIGSSAITAPVKTAGALGGALGVKSEPTDAQRDKVAGVLAGFFARQGKTVLSALGAGEDWWDGDRWDRELADDLLRVSLALSTVLGKAEAERLGYADGYDPDRTIAYLRTVAERYAGNVNTTTKSQIDAALDADEPPAAVFDGAPERAVGVATAVSTFVAGFGATEAGQQIAYDHGVEPTKTWNVNSKTPRPSHARMSGQTVPVGEPFSNGLMWPADSPDVDEVAGCKCSVTITIP